MALNTAGDWNFESSVTELEPPAMGRLAEISAAALVVIGNLDMPGIGEPGKAGRVQQNRFGVSRENTSAPLGVSAGLRHPAFRRLQARCSFRSI